MLKYTDITEDLCTRCGACCQVYIPAAGNDRYIEYLKQIGLSYIQDGPNSVQINLGPCPKLKLEYIDGEKRYFCNNYQNRPRLCRDYNCVAWAMVGDSYGDSVYVQKAEITFRALQVRKNCACEGEKEEE